MLTVSVGLLLFLLVSTFIPVGSMVNAQKPGITFPPAIFGSVRSQPAYEVSIPFSSQNMSAFNPLEISIPTGMTVIWFNDDASPHSIVTLANSTYSPPESINSGTIAGDGGSYIHTFSKPGTYLYYDPQMKTHQFGIVNVGSNVVQGQNTNMIIGGVDSMPFNAQKSKSIVFSFVPTTIPIPPATAITFKVALLDAQKKVIYSNNFDDVDGILDLELVPSHTTNATLAHFTDWGPDFIGEEQVRSDGVFHIKGPVLVENQPYYIQIAPVVRDNQFLTEILTDTFTLNPVK